MKTSTDSEFAAFVGIDWADRKHDVCLQAAGSSKRELSVLAHRPEAIAAVGRGAASALRRAAHCRVPGDRQGAAGVCPAALRVPGAVPGQPDHPGEVPGDLLRERGQGRPQRRATRPGAAESPIRRS